MSPRARIFARSITKASSRTGVPAALKRRFAKNFVRSWRRMSKRSAAPRSLSKPANGILLRGIAHQPAIPTFEERYKLKAACIAVYPMYKGLAQLVGMRKLEGSLTIAQQFDRYLAEYDTYNFFFIHYK